MDLRRNSYPFVALGIAAPLWTVLNLEAAQGFECNQAKTAAENAICADPAAKDSDDAMARAYLDLKTLLDPAQTKALVANQRDWLAERNQNCASGDEPAACIRKQNDERIQFLAGRPEKGPGLPVRLIPYFVNSPGGNTRPETSAVMYKQQGDAGPLDAAIKTLLDGVPKKDKFDADNKLTFERIAKIFYASDQLIR
jgi:uncharacterized protein